MDQFIAKHADTFQGSLSCFYRVLFRGYLPLFSGLRHGPLPRSRRWRFTAFWPPGHERFGPTHQFHFPTFYAEPA